jgi:hypothetical protein
LVFATTVSPRIMAMYARLRRHDFIAGV